MNGSGNIDDQWSFVEELFDAALNIPKSERRAWLLSACRRNRELIQRVNELLDEHESSDSNDVSFRPFIDDLKPTIQSPKPGDRFGPWLLEEQIGEGGMGRVFRARRMDGKYDRTVALKMLRPGLQSASRFRTESLILSRLEHPNIARLYDCGAVDHVPYLAMSYVDGESITSYVQTHQSTIQTILNMFLEVCDAVSYAHQRLIIHRDLKPSNILIDSSGHIHLLDFGIAQMLDESESEQFERTRTVAYAMTPSYAAPEQLRMQPITTATDIYALGIILYRLVAGTSPYDLERKSLTEIDRLICEIRPPVPSRRSVSRRSSPDLDTIIMKAIEKEPDRRYATVAALSDDVNRYVSNRPIRARKSSAAYRLRKFVSRNRLIVSAGVVVLVSLLGGLSFSIRQTQIADRERVKAERINDFIGQMLASANPYGGGGAITVRGIIDAAAERLSHELRDEPELEASIRMVLGHTYEGIGDFDLAGDQLERAFSIRKRLFGDTDPRTAATLNALGGIALERADYAHADTLISKSIAVYRDHSENTRALAKSLVNGGQLAELTGNPERAEALYRESLDIFREEQVADTAKGYYLVGNLMYQRGRYQEADSLLEISEQAFRTQFGPDNVFRAQALNYLAWVKYYLGSRDEVEPLLTEAHRIREKVLGLDHPEVGFSLNELGWYYWDRGDLETADSLYRRALKLYVKAYGRRNTNIPTMMNNVSRVLSALGQTDSAYVYARDALAIRRDLEGRDHIDNAALLNNLGEIESKRGNFRTAEKYIGEALELERKFLPPGHVQISSSLVALGELMLGAERSERAEKLFRQAVQIRRNALGAEHTETARAELFLALALLELGERERSLPLLHHGLQINRTVYGEQDSLTQRVMEAIRRAGIQL